MLPRRNPVSKWEDNIEKDIKGKVLKMWTGSTWNAKNTVEGTSEGGIY
jgi:hypothetical protein